MKIKGTVINTADGTSALPPAPTPPSRSEIDKLTALKAAADKIQATNYANWESLSEGEKQYTMSQRDLSNNYQSQIKSLETKYAADYARYQQELSDWIKLKQAIAQTDPELAKSLASINEATLNASNKKYSTIGIILVMVLLAIGFTVYLIKKRNKG
jgi:hypothetical protein